jgi:hypothetical protein
MVRYNRPTLVTSATRFFCALTLLSAVASARNLDFEDVWGRSKLIVYQLPDADGRAEAVRYIEQTRDNNKRGVSIVDVGSNLSADKGKLKDGFILYTTVSDKAGLLRLATRQLGWSVTGDSLHFREVTMPVKEARLILVGKNPYGRGYCAIYAAGSNRGLIDINNLYDGPSSFEISRGNEILLEGFYDEKFVSHERLSKAAALEDVNQFFATLQRVHLDPLRNHSAEDLHKLQQRTISGVESHADSGGEITIQDLALQLYLAAAWFKDGHTSVDWTTPPNLWEARDKRFPAFRLNFDNGRFLIAAARDQSMVNQELIAVNGTPIVEFLSPILDRSSAETSGFRAARFLGDELFWYYLTGLFNDATYTLKLRAADGQIREAQFQTLTLAEYRDFRRHGDPAVTPNNQGTKVEFLDSGATAHFLYEKFRGSPEEKKKIDQIFAEIKSKGSRELILDLRGNGGGTSAMGQHIFKYLYPGRFRVMRKLRFRAAWETMRYVPWWSRPEMFVRHGHTVAFRPGEHSARKPNAFFTGRTFLLVDNGTYSMAAIFATMVRDYKAGTIIGYETGGLPLTYGGPHHFRLKNSGIYCNASYVQLLPPMEWPGDGEHGVIPNVPVTEQSLAEFKNEKDPVLAFALRYIRTGAAPATTPSNASSEPAKK